VTAPTPLTLWEAKLAILACAADGVDHEGALALARVYVAPGEVAWDACCGQLTVSEVRRYPSTVFPVDEVDHTQECGANYLTVALLVTLLRCAPTPQYEGVPPTTTELQACAQQLDKDMGDLLRAVQCCVAGYADAYQLTTWEIGPQEVIGPQGGCIGTTLAVSLGFPNGCGCAG